MCQPAKARQWQIQRFYHALRDDRGYPETALLLIALTAFRPGEAADAEWDEFYLGDALWRRPWKR
ncbi:MULTISPECIES: hypothetical protein [Lonsdalea]|uniref:hypothetical protein n=1 Tax=Lonsdalea TaxID=1082702 RepID=UPI00197C78DF|nr:MULTISPECIES: hypothetical protein [Lonsdalea]